PVRIIEYERRQRDRILHTNTAVTEEPLFLREQSARRRVVQVDVERVGEQQLDAAERVGRAGILPKDVREAAARVTAVVDAAPRHLASRVGQYTHALACEVARVTPDRAQYLAVDAARHRPRRVQLDALHVRSEDRRGRRLLADDRARLEDHLARVQGVDTRTGHAHDE